MELADILSEESVLVRTDIKTKLDVLKTLAGKVADVTGHPTDEIFAALNDREALGSTGLGNGIAVPHGKYAELQEHRYHAPEARPTRRFRIRRRSAG